MEHVRGTLLVTGSTGVVGREVLADARKRGWDAVGCSSRGTGDSVGWDMTGTDVPASLRRPWDAIVHTAARPRWNLPAPEAWRANVTPVDAVASLITGQTHVVLLSTAFAPGLRDDVASPDLDDYRNTYEWSKAGSERRAAEVLGAVTVVRPPLVIGRREDGAVARFTGMYLFLHALTTSKLPALISDPDAYLDLVSTSDVSAACLDAAGGRRPPETTVDVLGRGERAARVTDLLDVAAAELNEWRAEQGGTPLEWPRTVTPDQWYRFVRPWADRVLSPHHRRLVALLEPFIPYMSLTQPLPVTTTVKPIHDCLRRCVRHWAQRQPTIASRDLRSWAPAGTG